MLKSILKLVPRADRADRADRAASRPQMDRAVVSLMASSVVASYVAVAVTGLQEHGRVGAGQLAASVVSIRATGLRADPFDPSGGMLEATRSIGTGFVVTAPSGARYALTNNHVVKDAFEVFLDDAPSHVVYADWSTDVAAILVAPPPAAAAAAKDATVTLCEDEPELGVEVAAIGEPFGFQGSLSRGVVSGLHRAVPMSPDLTLYDMVQTDALLNPGNSGGPLFDLERGCVIGMNTVIMTQPNGSHTGIGFAVPSHVLSDVVRHVDSANTAETPAAAAAEEQRFSVLPDAIADALGISGAIVGSADDDSRLQGTYRDTQGRPFVRDIIVGFRSGAPPAFDRVASASDLDVLLHGRGAAGGAFELQVARGDGLIELQFDRP